MAACSAVSWCSTKPDGNSTTNCYYVINIVQNYILYNLLCQQVVGIATLAKLQAAQWRNEQLV